MSADKGNATAVAREACRKAPISAISRRRISGIASVGIVSTLLAVCIFQAPQAVASSTERLRAAIASARSASCSPLRPDPVLDRAAEDVNRETDKWIDFKGRIAPADDPMPVLKDLGYTGNKAHLLQGANTTETASIKGVLIEGYLDIPDCSFTAYGVSVMQNHTTNYILAATIVAA